MHSYNGGEELTDGANGGAWKKHGTFSRSRIVIAANVEVQKVRT